MESTNRRVALRRRRVCPQDPAHLPGPNGVALPQADWCITRAPSEDEALTSDRVLLSGQSDDQGQFIEQAC